MSSSAEATIWVSGAGVVSCVGSGAEALWESSVEERTGISGGTGAIDETLVSEWRKSKFVGDGQEGRALIFALEAATQAMGAAGWEKLGPEDGVILATTTGQIEIWDQDLVRFLQNRIPKVDAAKSFRHQSLGAMLDALRARFSHTGRSALVTSACGAATQAIALGAMWIRQRKVRRCLVGGTEALCDLTIEGFKSLQLLSPSPAKPFDRDRTGINLSEGAGFLALESGRPRHALAKLSGYGMSTDGYHMTGPHPEGRGAREAILKALKRADLSPKDVSWVHAHGTGSELNDLAEGLALASVFEGETPAVSSTKRVHGHALGASGAIESVICLEAIRRQTTLKNGGLQNPDPRIPIRLATENQRREIRHVLKNTLGFGGVNATLVFSHPDAEARS